QERPLADSWATIAPITAQLASSASTGAMSQAPSISRRSESVEIGGGYRRMQRLGKGAFAEVYRGLAPGGVDVAIKRISQPIEREESQRELDALALIKQLRHPFLLATHTYRINDDDGHLYIVMELADGSLRDRLKQCREAGHKGIPVAELMT